MFGGKREKALEEELAAVKEANKQKQAVFLEITEQKDNVIEQFARMTASRAQMEKDIEELKENMQQVHELAENSVKAAGDIHNTMIEMNNGIGTFEVNHSVFVGQVKAQNEKVVEIVENNKHFTTPMKYITETPTTLKEEQTVLHERAARMMELSKNMSVLSLNCAIEAGRMGESGSRFIAAAEEVRSYSESYEREAKELEEQLAQADARIVELEEQVHHLNELLKENNISMGKLYKDCMQSMAAYEGGQIGLRELISETVAGKADALQQSETENAKAQEQMLLRMADIVEELKEQKSSADELETICKGVQQSVEKGQ